MTKLTRLSKLPKTPRIALLTIVAIGILSTTVFGAIKGFEYYSAKKPEAEVAGQVGADDRGGSEDQGEIDDTQDKPDEEEKEVSGPSGEVAGETTFAPTSAQQPAPAPQSEPAEPTSIPTQAPTSTPTPTPVPTSTPTPTPTPIPPSCCDEGTIKLLGEIAYKITSINRAIDSLKTSNQREYEEKSKCINNPDYDPLKVGLDGHKRLVAQCLDMHQSWIDKNNAEINRLWGEYGKYDRQKNSILAACPDCVDAWTAIVQAYMDKGWRI